MAAQNTTTHKIPSADGEFEIVWDEIGVPHVYAGTVADAYRGMGYACGSERLWQIHLSSAYANGEAAKLLGPRFVNQDAIQRACNVHGGHAEVPSSPGDWIVDAYLEGLNASVDALTDVPPEFKHANAEPRHFTHSDVAARYRFTSWFQHKTWTEKLLVGRLMACHGVDYFRHHLLHFSGEDAGLIEELAAPLRALSTAALPLAYPEFAPAVISGSNNWAVRGARSKSGLPILATDPHQPHSIPNTFFYVHLHAGDWDAFGAAFPGVPYFMMGYTRDIAWGLTTGFVDSYDVYIEHIRNGVPHGQYRRENTWIDLRTRTEVIEVKGAEDISLEIPYSAHGPLLEPLCAMLGLDDVPPANHATALHWSLAEVPTSAGALARLPLASSAAEFGDYLFEDDVCPLVNNIICVDKDDGLRRFIAATLPARQGATGSVPLPGWDERYDFARSRAEDLIVEVDPECGFALTANNDTMGDRGPYPIHNFPASSARADRIREILEARTTFDVADFAAAQTDVKDLRAIKVLPDLLEVLRESDVPDIKLATELLSTWDCHADGDSAAACVFYLYADKFWPRRFMRSVLGDKLINAIPVAAPGLSRFDIEHFTTPGSPWLEHRGALVEAVHAAMTAAVANVREALGEDPTAWRWGDLHQISLAHRLAEHATWQHMRIGPHATAGSATTLGMAMHMAPTDAEREAQRAAGKHIFWRVYHGPTFRLIVDLADPDHASFVIAGGNGGRPDSPYVANQFETWLRGDHFRLSLKREELAPGEVWHLEPM